MYRRTTLWLCFFLSLLSGLGLIKAGWNASTAVCVITLFLAGLSLSKRNFLTLIAVICFGVCCGLLRGNYFQRQMSQYDELQFVPLTVQVVAMTDGVYGKTSQMSFDANHVTLASGKVLKGKIALNGFGVNAVYQGDKILATGKMYPGYGAYQGKISFAKLELVRHNDNAITSIKRHFVAGMQSALPEPHAPFAMGLLVGQRATLPAQNKDDLLKVGLTHIIAVSGYNLTIILHASKRLIGRRSKRIGTALCLLLIGVFLVITGASASIVRAAVVSVLSIGASYYGRQFKPLNLIAFAAALTAMIDPVYLWSDLSWYLSFLAFFGVMVLGPILTARLPKKWHENTLVAVALESISAEIVTLPFVLHIFGQMSRVSLLANILVVSLIPLAMLLGLVAGLAGTLLGGLAGWFSWPAQLLLTYMLDVAHFLAGLPKIFVEGIGLSTNQMIGAYILIIIMTILLHRKTEPLEYDKITDRNLITTFGSYRERT